MTWPTCEELVQHEADAPYIEGGVHTQRVHRGALKHRTRELGSTIAPRVPGHHVLPGRPCAPKVDKFDLAVRREAHEVLGLDVAVHPVRLMHARHAL